jgi:hypothetical protein
MSDLKDLNRAVQSAVFPGHHWAQAVREWIGAATERMEGGGGISVECVEADSGYLCTKLAGHEGEHLALGLANGERHHWPKKPASEGGKAECNPWDHVWSWGECQTCKPAPPEPVAAEMPEAVLVNTWQLEELLKYADLAEVSIRTGFAPPSFLGVDLPYLLRNAIAAVRAQAAEAGIKLPKVREGISLLIWKIDNAQGAIAVEHYSGMLRSMLAELDTAEGRK